MANNDVIQAKKIIDDLTASFDKHNESIELTAKSMATYINGVVELPTKYKQMVDALTGGLTLVKQETEAIEKNVVARKANEDSVQKLISSKKTANTLTGEEIVNNRLLAQNVDNLAKQNSVLAGSYANLDAKAKEASKNLRDLIATGKLAGETQLEYNSRLQKAQTEFDGYNKKLLEADKAVGAWSRSNVRSVEGLGNLTSGLKSAMNAFGIFTGIYLAAQVTMGAIDINKHLSDDLAQLQIYLKGTKKDADDVFESIKKLDTRTSLADLLGLAQIVAKKGVVKEEIAGIVKELDSLYLVLGEEAGDKKEATASIVKLISIFNTDGKITAERVKEIGSSLQYLTTHGVATGKYLIDFSERLGAFRSLTGQTLPQIMGLGAGFEQLGQRVEVAGNATGQIITKLMSNAEKYAKMANIPLKEFKNLLETNSSEALIQFAEGMKKNSSSLEEFAAGFEDVGLKGARVKGVLAELSINGDLFRTKMDASAKAIENTGANAEAAGLKQKTFAATIDNLKKEFEKLVSTQGVQDFFSNIAIAIYRVTQAITAIPMGFVIGGLTAWVAIQAKLKGEIIATAIAQAWNNEQTTLGATRNVIARTGILGKAEAERVSTLSTEASTIALKANVVSTNEKIIAEREALVALEAETIGTELNTEARLAEITATKARIASLETEVVATEAVIAENEVMTLSLAATPWGAIAVAIGLVAYGLYELATAETEEEKVNKKFTDDRIYQTNRLAEIEADNAKKRQEEFDKIDLNIRKRQIETHESREKLDKIALQQKKEYVDAEIKELIRLNNETENNFNKYKTIQDAKNKDLEKRYADASKNNAGQYLINELNASKNKIQLERENADNIIALRVKTLDTLNKINDKQIVEEDEAGNALTEKQKREAAKRLEDSLRLKYEAELSNLERKKELIADEIKVEGKELEELQSLEIMHTIYSVAITERMYTEKKRIAKKDFDEGLITQKDYYNKLNIALNEFNTAKENAIADGQAKTKKLNDDYLKEQEGFQKRIDKASASQTIDYYKKQIADEKVLLADRKKYAEELLAFEFTQLAKEFKIAKAKAKLRGASVLELKALQAEYDLAYNKIFQDGVKVQEGLNKKDDNTKEIEYLDSFLKRFQNQSGFQSLFKILNKEVAGFGKNWKTTFVAMVEVAKDAFALINKNSQGNFEAEYARAQRQHDIAIAFAGNSSTAKTEIDRQYEEERKKIASKQAESKKQEAEFNIIVSTAEAIMSIWAHSPDFTGISQSAMTAIIAGIGALELAMVASAPLPQYWTGTDSAKGGLAIVDELRPEVHTDRYGKIKSMGSEGGANVRMTEQGDKIYKSREDYFNKELKSVLAQNNISPFDTTLQKQAILMVNSNNGMSKSDFDSGISKLASTINNKSEVEMNISKSGLDIYTKNGHTKKQQLNDLFTSKGKQV